MTNPATNVENVTEAELIAKATAPRVTEDGLKQQIAYICYFNADDAIAKAGNWNTAGLADEVDALFMRRALMVKTFCIIITKSGFSVTGESACASPENYDKEIGERLAYKDAFNRLWVVEGYLLKNILAHRVGPVGESIIMDSAGIELGTAALPAEYLSRLQAMPDADKKRLYLGNFDSPEPDQNAVGSGASDREFPAPGRADMDMGDAHAQMFGNDA